MCTWTGRSSESMSMNTRIGAGEQIAPLTRSAQMLSEHSVELTGVPEGELPQQGSDGRGRTPRRRGSSSRRCARSRGHRCCPRWQTCPRSPWPAWAPGWPNQRRSWARRCEFCCRATSIKPVRSASVPGRTKRDCRHRIPRSPRRSCRIPAPAVPFSELVRLRCGNSNHRSSEGTFLISTAAAGLLHRWIDSTSGWTK